MEAVVILLVVAVILVGWLFAGARGGGGRRDTPGPSGDVHPDPDNTDRPAGADAEDTTPDPMRFPGSQEDAGKGSETQTGPPTPGGTQEQRPSDER